MVETEPFSEKASPKTFDLADQIFDIFHRRIGKFTLTQEKRVKDEIRKLLKVEVFKKSEVKEAIVNFSKKFNQNIDKMKEYRVQRMLNFVGGEKVKIEIRDIHRDMEDDFDELKKHLGVNQDISSKARKQTGD